MFFFIRRWDKSLAHQGQYLCSEIIKHTVFVSKKYSWTLKFLSGSYSTNRLVERQKCCYPAGYGLVVFMFSTQTCMHCSSSVEIFSQSCLKMWLKCRWVQTHSLFDVFVLICVEHLCFPQTRVGVPLLPPILLSLSPIWVFIQLEPRIHLWSRFVI